MKTEIIGCPIALPDSLLTTNKMHTSDSQVNFFITSLLYTMTQCNAPVCTISTPKSLSPEIQAMLADNEALLAVNDMKRPVKIYFMTHSLLMNSR